MLCLCKTRMLTDNSAWSNSDAWSHNFSSMADTNKRLAYTRIWKVVRRRLTTDRNNTVSSDTSDSEQSGINDFHSEGGDPQPATAEPCCADEDSSHSTDEASDTDEDVWDIINECNDNIIESEDEDEENENDASLKEDIACWANRNLINHTALDDLLKILKRNGHGELPATARTLLQTPQNVMIVRKSGMDYIYFPLHEEITKFLCRYPTDVVSDINSIEISLNIDGLPIFKNTKNQRGLFCVQFI